MKYSCVDCGTTVKARFGPALCKTCSDKRVKLQIEKHRHRIAALEVQLAEKNKELEERKACYEFRIRRIAITREGDIEDIRKLQAQLAERIEIHGAASDEAGSMDALRNFLGDMGVRHPVGRVISIVERLRKQLAEAEKQRDELREAIATIREHHLARPCVCDCIQEFDGGGYYCECDCDNAGDAEDAATWCERANILRTLDAARAQGED